MLSTVFAQAQEAVDTAAANGAAEGATGAPAANPLGQMLPLLVAFMAIMYFLVWRPNQKREKERREMLGSISKGDKVVTTGGICGTVVGLTEKTVVLRVSEDSNVKMEFLRGAVNQVTSRNGDK